MNNIPCQALKRLIDEYGLSLCDNPARCRGLLKDQCNEYQLEINILIAALEEHVNASLLSISKDVPYELVCQQLIKCLQDTRGLGEEYARWAVNSWAEALGVYKPSPLPDATAASPNTSGQVFTLQQSAIQEALPSFYLKGSNIPPKPSVAIPSTSTVQPAQQPSVPVPPAPFQRSTNTPPPFVPSPTLKSQSSSPGNKLLLFFLVTTIIVIVIVLAVHSSQVASTNGTSPTPSYLPSGATLTLDDSLSSNTNGWSTGPNNNGGDCEFTSGSLQLSEAEAGTLMICMLPSSNFSNFVFEEQMTITQGDAGGLIFRASGSQFYALFVSENGGYTLDLYGANFQTLASGTSSAINQGLNQTNGIAVMAQDGTITIYANQQQIDQVQDTTLNGGQIGMLASAYGDSNAPNVVSYSNLKIWTF